MTEEQEWDVKVADEGSVALVTALSPAARIWLVENVQEDARFFGGAMVVEHRYIAPLLQGMVEDGLRIVYA